MARVPDRAAYHGAKTTCALRAAGRQTSCSESNADTPAPEGRRELAVVNGVPWVFFDARHEHWQQSLRVQR